MAKGFGKKESKKGTKREKAYLKLIDKLLKSQGTVRAINILRDNQHLIDGKLVERMEMVAMVLGEKGDREAAKFLRDIAEWLEAAEEFGLYNESGVFRKFVLQMMAATRNNGNPEAAYPILHAYRQQDPQFIQRFYNWGITQIEEAGSEKALALAGTMSMFGNVICEFPMGYRSADGPKNRAENVEVAIACHETALQVINRERYPELWGVTQDALATAYWNRINGDRAENQERAIDAYESALQVLTREVSPEEWGKIKNNLGIAYRDRIWGNKSENLEQAIKAHISALEVRTRTRDGYPERWAKTQMDLAADYRHRIEGDRAENLEQALAHCEKAFQVYTRQAFPQDWAGNKINLGNIYHDRISGDRSDNLEKAAQAYQNALAVFDSNRFPYKWALAQMNLGNVYGEQELIPEAIERYRLALEILTPDNFPQECFGTGYNMGNTALVAELWSEAIVGYRAAIAAIDRNLAMAISEARRQEIQAEAIDIYKGMVKACINDGQPEKAKEYAERSGSMRLMNNVTENNLTENNLDCNREAFDFLKQVMQKVSETGGDRQSLSLFLEANLDQLDQQFLQELCRLRVFIQSEVNPEEFSQLISGERGEKISANPEYDLAIMLVMALPIFANAVSQLLKGNRAINIEIAIAAYELVYPVCDPQVCSEYWGGIQMNLGVFYRIRIRGDRAANQEKAIACHKNALQIFTPESDPQEWGDTQNNLATVYCQQIKGDRAENMEQAIACCQEVLSVCTRDRFPAQWAYAKHNLGNFYGERVNGDRKDNLELAIRSYKDALHIHTREGFPHNWAQLQDALGIVYANRIKGDRVENIEQAITYFNSALQVITPDAYPQDWVKIQSHLGNMYNFAILGERAENLESAISYYQSALKVATIETMPEEWAMAQINLASAYSYRIEGNRESNLKAAIDCFQAASQVYSKRAYPQNWATLQNNLGTLYDKIGLIEQEIDCLQASLEVCTREAFPQDWADTQYNLGLAYRQVGRFEEALDCFRLSLEIFAPTLFPEYCLMSARWQGNTLFDLGRWTEAIEAYSQAIEAVETSRTWASSDFRRQEILAAAIDVYDNMVQACISNGQLDKAFETVERSRAQRLVDLMASNDLYQGGDMPPEVKELLQQYEKLQRQIDAEHQRHDSSNKRELNPSFRSRAAWQADNETIASLESEKHHLWEQIRRRDPVLAGQIQVSPAKIDSIQALIDRPTTAILSFYSTGKDTLIFILRQNQIDLQICQELGREILNDSILRKWLQPYVREHQKWQEECGAVLEELARQLQVDRLMAELDGIEELMIVPHFFLHQIPFAALPIGEGQYLGDKFIIRYIPSCQIWEFCRNRPQLGHSLIYGTVEDATEDLACAAFEGEQIAQLYNIPDAYRLQGKGQATVKNYRELTKKVQVLHASHHAQSRIDRPLESVLKLADGNITLGELMTPGWRLPDLSDVFLSCCETGLGVTEITDDLLTLATAFLCAGARSVVGTLWKVNDLAAALFSIFYYQERQSSKSRPFALQRAQQKLRSLKQEYLTELSQQAKAREIELIGTRKQYPKDSVEYAEWEREYRMYAKISEQIRNILNSTKELPFSHPRYWAAFTCQGLR